MIEPNMTIISHLDPFKHLIAVDTVNESSDCLGFTWTLLHGWCKYHMTSLPSLKNEVCVKGPEKKACKTCHNTDTTTTFGIYI